MRKIVNITYEGPINDVLDERIRNALESVGFDWYASGVEVETGKRDNSFYIPDGLLLPSELGERP